jgi:hypothetical protein
MPQGIQSLFRWLIISCLLKYTSRYTLAFLLKSLFTIYLLFVVLLLKLGQSLILDAASKIQKTSGIPHPLVTCWYCYSDLLQGWPEALITLLVRECLLNAILSTFMSP